MSTYATKNDALLSAAHEDDIPFIVLTEAQAPAFKDSLAAYQQAMLKSLNIEIKAGSAALLLDENGHPDKAFLVISHPVIWQAAQAAKSLPAARYRLDETNVSDAHSEEIQLGFLLEAYKPALHDDKADTKPVATCHVRQPSKRLEGLARGTILCRDLINAPANLMTPETLAGEATALAHLFGAQIHVTKGDALETHFPAIHIVGRAAEIQPCLIDMTWGTTGPLITLIGKGVTFDSGGLDLKPSGAMEIMKKDMGGSAHVLGLALAIMTSQLPVRLRVLIGAAENAVSDRSMRPLDIIDTRAGIKVEVGNTDAEGRLVLADALDLAKEDKPDFMVDFATLTGAARVALGTECPALFCNHDDTAKAIMDAGIKETDPLWHMPLFEAYDKQLDTGQMGLSSTGSSGFGGAITAALFLRRFTGRELNWAHIDVMAWNRTSQAGRPKGGEAMGLRALYHYIETLAQ